MTNRPDFHIGDNGTYYTLLIRNRTKNRPLNISGAITKQIKFEKPQGSTVIVDAEFTENLGVDGKIRYQWQENDLDEEGEWSAQGLLTDAAGSWHTDIEVFEVGENIENPP